MRNLSSSPVVEGTWKKRRESSVAKQSFVYFLVILFLLSLIYVDVKFTTVSRFLGLDCILVSAVEYGIGILLVLKVCYYVLSLTYFVWTYVFGGAVDLTDRQRHLLGVQQNEHGFRTPPHEKSGGSRLPAETSLIFTTNQGSFSGGDGSPTMRSLSPGFISSGSGSLTQYYSSYSPSQSPLGGSFNASFDANYSLNTSAPSPQHDSRNGSLRSRRSYSSPRSGSGSPFEGIRDQRTLHSFLQEQDDKEMRCKQAAQESLNSSSSSFWSYGSSALDLTSTLRKYTYQLASHLPQSSTKTSAADLASMSGVDEIWSSCGVTEDQLYRWTERLRKWLSATIVTEVGKKIDTVNKELLRIGCDDMQIGEVSVSMLKQLALTKGSMVQSLDDLVPYLQFFTNQEYLVRRIKDLSTGSMSEFTWNKGGSYSKAWAEHLLTDASLVMQLLCSYLDSRLPAQPRYMDGKVFTAEHFVKVPDKPDLQKKDNLVIYQTSINPPHFQVVIGTQTFNLPKGRNNMFQAILLFFYHVKTKEQGMLGRINLGMSGLNILWIFD